MRCGERGLLVAAGIGDLVVGVAAEAVLAASNDGSVGSIDRRTVWVVHVRAAFDVNSAGRAVAVGEVGVRVGDVREPGPAFIDQFWSVLSAALNTRGSNLLHVREVSFLLGAGASCDAELPIASGLAQKVLDHQFVRVQTQAILRFVVGQLLADRGAQGHNPYAGVDVERVMTAVEFLGRRSNLEVSPFVFSWHPQVESLDQAMPRSVEARRAVEDALSHIGGGGGDKLVSFVRQVAGGGSGGTHYRGALEEATAALVTILANHDDTAYLEPIFEVAASQGGCTVATLNYDLTVEHQGRAADHAIDTGMDHWTEHGTWAWTTPGVRLLKLHGSIDWQRRNDRVGALTEYRVETNVDAPRNPALIFGGANKLRADGPFLELLAQWDALLAAADDLVVVGYSFRDDHVNEVVRRWVNRSSDNRIVLIDPAPGPYTGPASRNQLTFAGELRDALRGVMAVPPRNTQPGRAAVAPRFLALEETARVGLPRALALLHQDNSHVWEPPESVVSRDFAYMLQRLSRPAGGRPEGEP